MNGEIYQLSMLVTEARNALTSEHEFLYSNGTYTNSIKFHFIPHGIFPLKPRVASNAREWFQYCIQNGVYDVKLLIPLQVQDRSLLGFVNASGACMLTFHRHGLVTYWQAAWEFDRSLHKWNVEYHEQEWQNPPSQPPRFENNKETFMDILLRIGEFADRIEFRNFGDIFRNAHDILSGKSEIPAQYLENVQNGFSYMPEEKKRMFIAASTADVFGAMGSWNDSPPYYAHEKGLDDEYESLSDELRRQLCLAILYAVNET